MAFNTEKEKLRKVAVYESLPVGEKVFFRVFQAGKAMGDIKHKLGKKFGNELPTTEEEIEILENKRHEIEAEEELLTEKNKLLKYIEDKAMERRSRADREKG